MCVKSLKNMQSFQEKMHNITTYHFTLVRLAIIKNLQINTEGGVKKRDPSYTVGEKVNQYCHYGEQYAGSLKN